MSISNAALSPRPVSLLSPVQATVLLAGWIDVRLGTQAEVMM